MKPSIEREQRLFDALKTITKYSGPDDLRRVAQRKYGLDGEDAIEAAYENVLQTARDAIKGLRRPESSAGNAGVGVVPPRWTASPDELLHALHQWWSGTIDNAEFYERARADLTAMCQAKHAAWCPAAQPCICGTAGVPSPEQTRKEP